MHVARYDLPGRGMLKSRWSRFRSAYWGQLFVVNSGKPEECYVTNGNERERILGTLAQIDRAISTSPTTDSPIPNIEFSLSLDDLPLRSKAKGAFFGYTRKDTPEYDNIWMMPNYVWDTPRLK
jgi:protein glucosyltransferase